MKPPAPHSPDSCPPSYCTQTTLNCEYNPNSPGYNFSLRGADIPVCCATHLVALLGAVAALLEEAGIPYFLYWGSFLGAVRQGGLIPWDGDVDLGMAVEHVPRLLALEPKLKQRGFRVETALNSPGGTASMVTIYYSRLNFLHVNIDLWEPVPTGGEWVNREWPEVKLAATDLFPLRRYRFHEHALWGPHTTAGLTSYYGKDCLTLGRKMCWQNSKKIYLQQKAVVDFHPAEILSESAFPRFTLNFQQWLWQEMRALHIRYTRSKWIWLNWLLRWPRRLLPFWLRDFLWRQLVR